ncbi:DNA-directed DNA polymerase [Nostoc sphaeroides CHAB 2801]|uniref:DNA polymerase n=1 Tax=Nostoc sphaeroides TaxID=446679 RepID=UPI001E5E3CC9|nr:DNA polymerase [Nostoc sphaeroides]MCC5631932.1 DNA-directed DNA polymerase [Nostoc sphaeroides CHAB 2801]
MNTGLVNTNNTSIYTPQYTLVSNVSILNSALQPLFQAEILAIDCETTGLDPLTDSIRLIQIAAPNHPVVLIDLPAIPKSDRQLLKKLLCNSAVKIAHNAKFDWQFLTLAGLQPSGQFFDTQLAYKVLTAGLKTSSSLQNIVKKLLHLQLDKTQQISDWCKPLTKVQLHYAAVDAAILLDLYPILLNKLKQAKLLKIARLEFQCMPVVAQMELNGMLFDLSRWQILGAKLEAEKTDALSQLKQLRIASSQMSLLPELTDAVNPNSPQQVLAALQAIGIKINSTNQSKLVSLAAQYPIIQALLSYRRLSKISRLAKAINFGLIFGMGAAKLQIYAQVKYGVAMTLEQAKAFSKRFFEAYPGIARWHKNIKRKYIQGIKESRTLANRRRRWVNKPRLSELFNHPVQGLNADINKLAMVKLSNPLAKFRTKLICVRHDEIVLECPETEVDQVSHILHNCMVAAAQKFLSPIPVVIDIKISNSW